MQQPRKGSGQVAAARKQPFRRTLWSTGRRLTPFVLGESGGGDQSGVKDEPQTHDLRSFSLALYKCFHGRSESNFAGLRGERGPCLRPMYGPTAARLTSKFYQAESIITLTRLCQERRTTRQAPSIEWCLGFARLLTGQPNLNPTQSYWFLPRSTSD